MSAAPLSLAHERSQTLLVGRSGVTLRSVHHISFAISTVQFPVGECRAIEAVIDGVSIVDRVARIQGERQYAGLAGPGQWLATWRKPIDDGPQWQTILGGPCGDSGCSYVVAYAQTDDDVVWWSNFTTSSHTPLADLEPFGFAKAQFEDALRDPCALDAPIREPHDLVGLAAADPPTHDDWLRAMTLALGRDFLWAGQPADTSAITRSGLQAFAAAGNPMTGEAVRRWANKIPYTPEAVEQLVELALQPPQLK